MSGSLAAAAGAEHRRGVVVGEGQHLEQARPAVETVRRIAERHVEAPVRRHGGDLGQHPGGRGLRIVAAMG